MVRAALAVFIVLSFAFLFTDAKKPNFLILYADDLGVGDVGCFGNDTIRTPHIDSLCRGGAKLSHHLAVAAVCTPSRAALMTGRYPIRSGMSSNINIPIFVHLQSWSGLPANETTFAKHLQNAGYKTGLIGKWHLGMHCETYGDYCHFPTNHGFDYFFGTPLTNHRGMDPRTSGGNVAHHRWPHLNKILVSLILSGLMSTIFLWRKGFHLYALLFALVFGCAPLWIWFQIEHARIFQNGFWRNDELVEQPMVFDMLTQRLVNEGVKFLKQRKADRQPFLLMMSWIQVHTYLHAEKPFKGRSKHGRYGDEVEELDWSIGEMLRALENMGFDEDTVVYFSADNGGHIEEIGLDGSREGGHNGIYRGSKFQGGQEGGYREPAAIRYPGHIKPGSEVSEPTSQMDIFPTFLRLAGIDLPTDRVIDGKDMMPALTGNQEVSAHRFIFHYCCLEIHSMRYRPEKGSDMYKLHLYWPDWDEGTMRCYDRFSCGCYNDHHLLDKPKLFNIANDPSESDELNIADDKYAAVVEVMFKGLEEHQKSIDPVPNQFDFKYSMYRPWLHHCCNFPYCHCTDPTNALYS